MNVKIDNVRLISGKTDSFPTNQYIVTHNNIEYVCWTPHELQSNKMYWIEFQEKDKTVKDGDKWLKLQKVKLTTAKTESLPTPPTIQPAQTTSVSDDSRYHEMAMDYLWKTNKLSLSAIKKLAPHFKSICEGTINEKDLALFDLEFYDATEPI